jgi:hypothetical protein
MTNNSEKYSLQIVKLSYFTLFVADSRKIYCIFAQMFTDKAKQRYEKKYRINIDCNDNANEFSVWTVLSELVEAGE